MMGRQKHSGRVEKLEFIQGQPSADRVQLIRDWHLAQSASTQLPVALLSLSITDCGEIRTAGLAIEPEHALIFLGEIDAITERLRSYIEARRAHTAPAAVMRLGRCA